MFPAPLLRRLKAEAQRLDDENYEPLRAALAAQASEGDEAAARLEAFDAARKALKCEAPERRGWFRRAPATADDVSYAQIVADIARKDGASAFFTRGLSTRILANGLQSIVFTVVWRTLFDAA